MMKKHLPFIFILLFASTLLFQLAWENVLLTDDLSRVRQGEMENTFWEFINKFLNTNTMSSRPISGIFYAPSIYFIKYLGLKFYYINYLFYIISLIVVYKVFSSFFHKNTAVLGVFIYAVLPLGTSTIFSPIMMNSSLATIFYGLSLMFIHKYNTEEKRREEKRREEKRRASDHLFLLTSIGFYFLSVLSYEIFLPLILLNAYLIKDKISTKILYTILVLAFIFGYRQILEPILFSNYYHRNNETNFLDFSRNLLIIKDIFTNIFIKLPYSIFRGVRAIVYYSILDFVLLIGFIIFSFHIAFKTKFDKNLPKNFLLISVVGIIFSFSIFFLSVYRPNIWDFDNRNLGVLRLFSSFGILCVFIVFIRKSEKWTKIGLFSTLIILSITMISTKNAWIYSYHFNIKLFEEIKKHLPENPKSDYIYLTYDKTDSNDRKNLQRQDPHFVFIEPIFHAYWEYPYLINKVGISQNYKIEYIHYHKNDRLQKSYYLFDYKTKKMEYVQE